MHLFLRYALTGLFVFSLVPAQVANSEGGSGSNLQGAGIGSTSGSNQNQQRPTSGSTSGSNQNQQGPTSGSTSGSNQNQQGTTSGSTSGSNTYGTPVVGAPQNTYTQSCLPNIVVNTQFDNGWLVKNAGAGASASNVNQVQVALFNSNIEPGYVSCYYRSARTEINNLVYKYVCKNAIKAGVHQYYCAK
jgi:hypothetical protein